MEYYIVINEWNYPTESGREFIGDLTHLWKQRLLQSQSVTRNWITSSRFVETITGKVLAGQSMSTWTA